MASALQNEPDLETIKAHLAFLFDPAQEHYPDGLIEIAYGPDKPSKAQHFFVTPQGQEMAAAFAQRQNALGQNIYVGVNPRRKDAALGHRTDASAIEIAFFHFADLDQIEAVESARKGLPIKPHAIVMTGTQPHQRPHFYWRLTEPVRNLAEWSEQQRAIAVKLGGDAVIDPPRIMRLAGTINHPPAHKLAKGYAVEPTALRTNFADERPDIAPWDVPLSFPPVSNVVPIRDDLPVAPGQTTLSAMSGKARISDLIRACQAGQEWHNNMVRLVAHLVAVGRTDAEMMLLCAGLTLPGYQISQTEYDVAQAIRGARSKWAIPAPDETIEDTDSPPVYETLSLDQLERLPPPTYLIDEILPEHGLTFVYGDPGAGKSFIVLDMALRLAYGMDWHGTTAKQTGVLYIAGEGKHGLGKRVKGWRREHGLEGAEAPFKLLPVAVHMLDADSVAKLKRTITAVSAEVDFTIGLIVIDTVSRAIPGHDENKQDTMSLFVDGCADLHDFTNGAVIGVHHSGKDKDRGMRGSTVLLGACEASVRVSKDEQTVCLSMEKQKDDEAAGSIYMTMKKVEWAEGFGKSLSTLVPEKSGKPVADQRTLSRRQADEIFDLVDDDWGDNNPWSAFPQGKRRGRYLVSYIAEKYEVSHRVAEDHVTLWQSRGYMKSEPSGPGKAAGLRVIRRLED